MLEMENYIIKEANIENLTKDSIIDFLNKNGGVFFLPQEYGPKNPLGDTDYYEFITSSGNEIFYGYSGCDSFESRIDSECIHWEDAAFDEEIEEELENLNNRINDILSNSTIWYCNKDLES